MNQARTSALLALLVGFASLGPADPKGERTLFNGADLSHWIVPEGDNGHWKVIDGVIDYDARSEATGNKNLVSKESFADFVLTLEWRIKETPYTNPCVPYVLPDGTHARDVKGKEIQLALPDSDSGVYLRDPSGKSQVNIWCWPIGSGEVYGYRMDSSMPPEVRAGVTPSHPEDKPVGVWNRFEITLKRDRLTVVLNGVVVIEDARLTPASPKEARSSCSITADTETASTSGPRAWSSSGTSASDRSERSRRICSGPSLIPDRFPLAYHGRRPTEEDRRRSGTQ